MDPMVWPILGLVLPATLLSAGLTWAVRAIGTQRALLDSSGSPGHTKALRSVPNIGGIAIFWTLAALLGGGLTGVWFDLPARLFDASTAEAIARHTPGIRAQTPMALGLLLCLTAIHTIGLVDDRRAVGVLPKILVIVGAAVAMALAFDVRMLTVLDGYVGGSWLSVVMTVIWIVAITNAMNFIDNMDGLSASVGAISGSFFLAATMMNGQWFVAAVLAVLVAALLGFLCFNFPRPGGATIFMGDGGSLIIGFLLAFLTVRATYVPIVSESEILAGPARGAGGAWYGVFMPLCVLAVPLYDLVSVSLIRLSQGKSPFVGDQRHFSHRLRDKGLTTTQTLAVICGCTAITGIGGVLLTHASGWEAILIGAQTLLTLTVLGLYEFASDRNRAK